MLLIKTRLKSPLNISLINGYMGPGPEIPIKNGFSEAWLSFNLQGK